MSAGQHSGLNLGDRRATRRMGVVFFLAVTLALRINYIFLYRFNSDEPQHLHVIWAWTQGLVQYVDIFDNHTPLFHLLLVPLQVVVGERPEALFFMRLAMIPFYFLLLWQTVLIGRILFSSRVALWSMILLGLLPEFFFKTLEFRPDTLWAVVWLTALLVLLGGPVTKLRSFVAGVLLGASLGVSIKTNLLLVSLLGGTIGGWVVCKQSLGHLPRPFLIRCLAAGLTGFLLVPLTLILFLGAHGALESFVYCTILFNAQPPADKIYQAWSFLLFPVGLLLAWQGARFVARSTKTTEVRTKRTVVFLTMGIYVVAFPSFWPKLVYSQNFLPVDPLAAVFCTAALLNLTERTLGTWIKAKRIPAVTAVVLSLVAAIEGTAVLTRGPIWHNGTRNTISMLTDVLRLAGPNDYILDVKGETIFRPRPCYYLFEVLTRTRIKLGLLPDTGPEEMISNRACVAVLDTPRFPLRTREFLNNNTIPVGRLRVAGAYLKPPQIAGESISFDIAIPALYAIVSEKGLVEGVLDDKPFFGSRFLASGRHEFIPDDQTNRLAVVWAQAVKKGFLPVSFTAPWERSSPQ